MKTTLTVVFGKEPVAKIHNHIALSEEERLLNVKAYTFDSEKEKQAFINGLNEAVGWLDVCIAENEITPVLLTGQEK